MRCCQHLVKSMSKRAPLNLVNEQSEEDAKHAYVTFKTSSFSSCSISRAIPPLTSALLLFDLHRSQAHEWMHRLQKVLEAALGQKMVLPERKLDNIEAFLERFAGVKRVMIDGTERPIQRPQDPEQQQLNYSGKKKGILANI